MVRGKILQIFLANADSEEYSRFSLFEKNNLQTLVINVNPIKNSQIKINIASNETIDVFGLD